MQSSEVTSIPYAFLFGVDSRVSLRGQCSQFTIDSLRDVFSSFSAAWALETSQIAAIRTWRIDLLSIVRACFENGWRGPLARPGRRPADRSGRAPPCKQAVPIGSDRGSRSVRRVAGRHRRVACATRKRFSTHALRVEQRTCSRCLWVVLQLSLPLCDFVTLTGRLVKLHKPFKSPSEARLIVGRNLCFTLPHSFIA